MESLICRRYEWCDKQRRIYTYTRLWYQVESFYAFQIGFSGGSGIAVGGSELRLRGLWYRYEHGETGICMPTYMGTWERCRGVCTTCQCASTEGWRFETATSVQFLALIRFLLKKERIAGSLTFCNKTIHVVSGVWSPLQHPGIFHFVITESQKHADVKLWNYFATCFRDRKASTPNVLISQPNWW